MTPFDFNSYPKDMRDAASKFLNGAWCLYLYGPVGSGKSCFAATVHRMKEKLHPTWVSWWLASRTLARWMKDLKEWPSYMFQILRIPILTIDDLGSERGTPYITSEMSDIILDRYDRGAQLIITSNLSPERLAEHLGCQGTNPKGLQISSRLQEGAMIKTKGTDLRKKEQNHADSG